MGTPNRFYVYIAGVLVTSAWSVDAANKKLLQNVMFHASTSPHEFPLQAQIINSSGQVVKTRSFGEPIFSSDLEAV